MVTDSAVHWEVRVRVHLPGIRVQLEGWTQADTDSPPESPKQPESHVSVRVTDCLYESTAAACSIRAAGRWRARRRHDHDYAPSPSAIGHRRPPSRSRSESSQIRRRLGQAAPSLLRRQQAMPRRLASLSVELKMKGCCGRSAYNLKRNFPSSA